MVCVKAGSFDSGENNLGGKVDIEFYVKDRVSYCPAVAGAKQEQLFV